MLATALTEPRTPGHVPRFERHIVSGEAVAVRMDYVSEAALVDTAVVGHKHRSLADTGSCIVSLLAGSIVSMPWMGRRFVRMVDSFAVGSLVGWSILD